MAMDPAPRVGELHIDSRGGDASYDITDQVTAVLSGLAPDSGVARVCAVGSTVGLTVMRYEPGAVQDLLRVLDTAAPRDRTWEHERTTGDPNGFAHVKCSLMGTGVLVPIRDRRLDMPALHRIVLFDFDLRPASRRVVVAL
jgi:secondary thiamine-phosphate synthase enzyme